MLQHVLICQHNLSTIDDVRDEVKEHLMALGFRGTLLCIEICKSETLITFQLSANQNSPGLFQANQHTNYCAAAFASWQEIKRILYTHKRITGIQIVFLGTNKTSGKPKQTVGYNRNPPLAHLLHMLKLLVAFASIVTPSMIFHTAFCFCIILLYLLLYISPLR